MTDQQADDPKQTGTGHADTDHASTEQLADDDGYAGPAELVDGDVVVQVTVNLRGHFDPISGSYNWYGRITGSPAVTALLAEGGRTVRLRTPHGEVETALADVDPWGRPRVEGFGAAPFAVLAEVPAEEG